MQQKSDQEQATKARILEEKHAEKREKEENQAYTKREWKRLAVADRLEKDVKKSLGYFKGFKGFCKRKFPVLQELGIHMHKCMDDQTVSKMYKKGLFERKVGQHTVYAICTYAQDHHNTLIERKDFVIHFKNSDSP